MVAEKSIATHFFLREKNISNAQKQIYFYSQVLHGIDEWKAQTQMCFIGKYKHGL